jgi:hypothetical protein
VKRVSEGEFKRRFKELDNTKDYWERDHIYLEEIYQILDDATRDYPLKHLPNSDIRYVEKPETFPWDAVEEWFKKWFGVVSK